MYGNQQQPTAPPQPNYGAPPENYGVESQPFANDGDDDGISAFSDKSVRQGKQFMFICCFFFIELICQRQILFCYICQRQVLL